MAKLTDLDKERKKHNRRRVIKRLLVVLFLSAIIFILYQLRYEIASDGLSVWMTDTAMEVLGRNDFPVELDTAPRQMVPVGQRVAVIGEANLSVYNSTGSQVMDERLGYQNPIAVSSGKRLLIYDRGSYNLSVRMGSRVLLERNYDYPILAATLAPDGQMALATDSTGYLSQVTVSDDVYSNTPIFTWNSSRVLVSTLSFDPKSRLLAVGGVSTQGGMLRSTMLVFEIATGKEVFSAEIEDELILSLGVRESGEVTAVTDRSALSFSASGERKGRFAFGGEPLDAFHIDVDGSVVVAYGNYETSHRTLLVSLGHSMEKLYETQIDRRVSGLLRWGKGILAYTGDKTLRYTPELTLAKVMDTSDSSLALVVGDHLYYATTRELKKSLIG